jgi:signal transduction histidine kinase
VNRSLRQARRRLAAAVIAVFFVVGGAATVGVWLAISHAQYASIDDTLRSQAQLLEAGLQNSGGHVSFDGAPLPDVTAEGDAVSALLYGVGGRVLAQSGATPGDASLLSLVHDATQNKHAVIATVTSGGTVQRVLVEPMPSSSDVTGVLAVSRALREVQHTLFLLGLFLGGTLIGLTFVVGLLAYALAGRAMRPVRAMTATLQQFTADAAHELRAPLTLMRAELETSLAKPRSPEEYRSSERVALHEVQRLSVLSDQLLTLARSDVGALELELRVVDLGDLVDETVARWQPFARAGRVALTGEVEADCAVRADQLLLRRLLDNLLDNAIRHTPSNGEVRLTLDSNGAACTLCVADTGPGVPAAQRATLFERFTRGDAARGRQTGGAGLGLALCRVIAQLHGGTIVLEDSSPGAVFRVRLPVAR